MTKTYVGNSSNKAIIPKKIYAGNSSNKAVTVKAVYVGNSSNKAVKVWPYNGTDNYQRVEYIRNSGKTQYIDVGVKANSDTRMLVDIYLFAPDFHGTDQVAGYFGSSGLAIRYNAYTAVGSSYFLRGYRTGSSRTFADIYFTGSSNITTLSGLYPGRHVFDFNREGGKIYMDDVLREHSTETFPYTNYNVELFAIPDGDGNEGYWAGECEIYHVQMWQNGVQIRDMYPCYRKSDNVIGMYDLVEQVFYQNKGTGTFYKGSNVNW